ncbi:MAG: putative amino-acid acetyltransferase [Dehalococcoidia bacterium]|nr:putative amino-acid acetyltransferase [Dehalococcoidia bacterium]
MKEISGGTVTSPGGFSAGATYAGLKTHGQDKLDLGLLYSERPCHAAGVFTQNRVASATVPLSRSRVAAGPVQAIIVNSGCANACVGKQGMLDALEMGSLAAKQMQLPDERVLVASTGVIGVELPMALLRRAVSKIELGQQGGHHFARAIMTTDTHPKEVAATLMLGGKQCAIGAVVKGVGMIHPNMATMLCFITTDAAVDPQFLRDALHRAVDGTLNMLTVDGDTSTNDMAVILANGVAGNAPVRAGTEDAARFDEVLQHVCLTLTRMIARDGEGASKLMEVSVTGAASLADARKAARAVVRSPLVKSAVHGGDPNWGRIISAIGSSGADVQEERLKLTINGIVMLELGTPIPFFKDAAVQSMKESDIQVQASLGMGEYSALAWGCDLTEEYVRFNSAYTT